MHLNDLRYLKIRWLTNSNMDNSYGVTSNREVEVDRRLKIGTEIGSCFSRAQGFNSSLDIYQSSVGWG